MFNIQNLTNKTLCFQGTTIAPYGTLSLTSVYDYITLAKLTNSGKARYFTTADIKTEIVEVKAEVKEEVKETPKKEETVIEPETKTEITSEVIEDTKSETTKEETEEEFKKEKTIRTTNKRGKKRATE